MKVFQQTRKSIATIALVTILFSIIQMPQFKAVPTAKATFTGIQTIMPLAQDITYNNVARKGVTVIFTTNASDTLTAPDGSCLDSRACYDTDTTITLEKDGTTYQPLIVTRTSVFSAQSGEHDRQLTILFNNLSTAADSDDKLNLTFAASPGQLSALSSFNGGGYVVNCGNGQGSPTCAAGGGGSGSGGATGVTLSDADTTGYGLTGKDFKVRWTPSSTTPSGYTGTRIFIVQSGVTLTNATLNSACTGVTSQVSKTTGVYNANQCIDLGYFTSYQNNEFIVPDSETKDSNNTAWSTVSGVQYKGCVLTQSSQSTLDCSSATTITSETSVTDSTKPVIDHISSHTAINGATAVLHLYVFDDQTVQNDFHTQATNSYVKMHYKVDSGSTSTATCAQVSNAKDLFTCTTSAAVSGTKLKYLFEAKDKAGNINVFNSVPGSTSTTENFFETSLSSAGSRTVAGTVKDYSGNNLSSAYVYIEDLAKAGVNTDGSGNYTLSNVPDNYFGFAAAKTDYCDSTNSKNITANVSGLNFSLTPGNCSYNFSSTTSSTTGGQTTTTGTTANTSGKPHRVFSGPSDGMSDFPTSEKIRVGFDMSLSAGTVNDSNAGDASSNVYLTTTGSDKISGTATYCPAQSSAGCSALVTGDTNTILFTPTAALTSCTYYSLVITSAVTSESSQPIEGSRSGGGDEIHFTTSCGGGTGGAYSSTDINANYGGSKGQYMPPYVRSVYPAPGATGYTNSKIFIEFSEAMDRSSLTSSNLKLFKVGTTTALSTTISVDSNSYKYVTLTPASALENGAEYEVQVFGACTSSSAISLGDVNNVANPMFKSNFFISGADATAPTVYTSIQDNSTNVDVTRTLEYGPSEALDPSTITSSNITLARGSSSVTATPTYDIGKNSIYIASATALAPNTKYTVTFGTGVKDLNGVALASARAYSFTTGNADTTLPKIKECRADDYRLTCFFTERMISDGPTGSNYSKSVINTANWTITQGPKGSETASVSLSGKSMTYDSVDNSVTVEGISMTVGNSFLASVGSGVTDFSDNVIESGGRTFKNAIESASSTGGCFDCGGGMFSGSSYAGDTSMGNSAFKSEGFGNFTGEQFAFGDADMAFPFNPMASQDSSVFQTRFKPGIALENADQVQLTFPNGTALANTVPDTFSPFYNDMNESHNNGTIKFGPLDSDGVQVDTTTFTVTVQLAITGTTTSDTPLTIDLRGITNPIIPKGSESGGYTVGIKVVRGSNVLVNKTSMPYFINEAGLRSITVNLYAGSQASPTAVSGSVFLFAGGPAGPMDSNLTVTNGTATKAYNSMPDGCYYFGTEPFVTLGSQDFFGQMSPDPICVNSTTTSVTKNIVLSSATASGASATLTVKLAGINTTTTPTWASADVDIFAGGPGKFVVKTLTDIGTPVSAGYTLRLPSNGHWFVGVGPAMPKTFSKPESLPASAPPPIDLNVSGLGTGTVTITSGFKTPNGASFDSATNTVTFTFSTADKAVTGTVKDAAGNTLKDVEVFAHAQGFGQPTFTTTNTSGAFTLNLSNYGSYEIGAFKDGLPPKMFNIEVLPDGSDAGTDIDVFFKGAQITATNPLVLKLKKPAYYISGKVLDASNNGIGYMPIFGVDATNGDTTNGFTGSDGSYTVFVDAGTWTLKGDLPPDKSDSCGTLSKTVTVTTENKTNQNLTPSVTSCVTLSGSVTVGSTALSNTPLFVGTWDTTNDRPIPGFFRQTSTDSSGNFNVKVAANATYKIGTFHPDFGEITKNQTVTTADVSGISVTTGTTGTLTLAFTGGTASMESWIECKHSLDKNTRIGASKKGLNSNQTFTLKEGIYSCAVNVFGIDEYAVTVATGATGTIDLSSKSLVAVTGNINDGTGTDLAGALVTLTNTSTGTVESVVTDSSGNYTATCAPGTYTVDASIAGYVPGQAPQSLTVGSTGVTNYDFGGSSPDQSALTKATDTIVGTLKDSSSVAMDEGMVWAENTAGVTVAAPVEADGTYTLPVVDGTWTIKAVGEGHKATTLASTVSTVGVTVATGNITLTTDASTYAKPVTDSDMVTNSVGGVIQSDDTDIKLAIGAGELTSGNADIVVNTEKAPQAPETTNFEPLANMAYEVEATANSSTLQDLNGFVDIQLDYTDIVAKLPTGVLESDMKLVYYSSERDEYIPVEGGFTIDTVNNLISGSVDHFTTFAIVYVPVTTTPPTSASSSTSTSTTSSGGGGGTGATTTTTKTEQVAVETTEETTGTSETVAEAEEEAPVELPFTDTVGHWAESYIGKLFSKGVISGYNPTTFGPDDLLTRAQLTKIMLNLYQLGAEIDTVGVEENPFSDVDSEAWYAGYVAKAKEFGIVQGYSDGTFKPDQPVNRAEAMKIVFETANFGTAKVVVPDVVLDGSVKAFNDVGASEWYAKYVYYARSVKVVQGYDDGTFRPNQNITRAEFSKIATLVSDL